MKYEFCGDCYFYGVEPAICDACDEGDQFEPLEAEEGAYEELARLSRPQRRVISIVPVDAEDMMEAA